MSDLGAGLDNLVELTPTLASLGWNDTHDTWADAHLAATGAPGVRLDDPGRTQAVAVEETALVRGRLARVSRGFTLVFTGGDALLAASGRTRLDVDEAPATGDYALISDDPTDGPAIAAISPRTSALRRRAAGRVPEPQVLATNVDVVLVMHGLDREVNLRRLERQLVVAWDSGATPLVVLTKADTASDVEATVAEVATIAPGVEVLASSTKTGRQLDRIADLFAPNRSVAMLGLSGVGKSSLVNALSEGMVQLTGEVRATDQRGRHTTVTRDLIPLPGGGFVIDAPGVREIGLWQAYDGLALAFPEVAEAAERCRFADCEHGNEPGCAVRAGIESGAIAERRLDHWRHLQAELALQESQLEEFARRAESRDRADAENQRDQARPNRRSRQGGGKGGRRGGRRRR